MGTAVNVVSFGSDLNSRIKVDLKPPKIDAAK